MRQNPETKLKASILNVLHLYGVEAWNSPSGHARRGRIRMAPKGTADLIGYLPGGRMIALEVKRPGEVPEPHQVAWRMRASAAGVCAHVVHSASETSALLQEVLRAKTFHTERLATREVQPTREPRRREGHP